ncbi:MAG TPA: hypothetical protein EYP65_02915 [Armatimonadetes bacterium]|nr:hypothetical protein [Armatimonadota bacterium]
MVNEMELDALKEVGNIGAGHAATSLSQLLNRTIEISVQVFSRRVYLHHGMLSYPAVSHLVRRLFLGRRSDTCSSPGLMSWPCTSSQVEWCFRGPTRGRCYLPFTGFWRGTLG